MLKKQENHQQEHQLETTHSTTRSRKFCCRARHIQTGSEAVPFRWSSPESSVSRALRCYGLSSEGDVCLTGLLDVLVDVADTLSFVQFAECCFFSSHASMQETRGNLPPYQPAVVQHFALEDFSNTLDCMGDGVPVAHAVESTCRFGWDDPHPLPCRFGDRPKILAAIFPR